MPSSSTLRFVMIAGVLTLATPDSRADTPAPASPFLPPASAISAATPAGAAPYDLVGMTAVGKDTLLSINRHSDRRSTWIALGKTVGEITAVSYDPATDQAVIRADGQTFTLPMRQGTVVSGGPALPPAANTTAAPAFLPAASNAPAPVSVPTKPMTVQEEKEMEARMLVTDLLEIGQQQRKAYEEAQRQAAVRAAAVKTAPSAQAQATPGAQPPTR